jgi:acylphosphatase
MQRRWLFQGRVQGVGFRAQVHDIAKHYHVSGYVRNLDSGDVELVAEGQANELLAFFEAIQNTLSTYIRNVETDTEDEVRALAPGFVIEY